MAQGTIGSVNEESFEGTGELRIAFRSWRPERKPRGVVVIVPGFNSHSGYYDAVARALVADDLAVYAIDLRGRGKSDGERFYVETFTDYVTDAAGLVALAQKREADLPTFLLGHSAGGVVACLYTVENQAGLAGLICDSFAYQVPAPDFVLALGDLTYANAHGQSVVDQHFNDVMVWSVDAAYMPAWGNHEYGSPQPDSVPGAVRDTMENYKGRSFIANGQSDPTDTATQIQHPGCGWATGSTSLPRSARPRPSSACSARSGAS